MISKPLQITTHSNPAIAYRAEIDGLRAIAVLSVLIYHAFPQLLPSGFIGVDIFFVISGYLITSILIKEIENNEFSFSRFYERRARRLLPPLLPVLAATAVLCAAILSESKFADFLDSVKAASLFSSNWYFYSTISYFETPGLVTPLLHTWSLSIEEQFYFIFPAILLLSYKLHNRPAAPVIGALLLTSLAYSIYLLSTNQNEAAFYNSAARFWELSIGCLVAAIPAIRSSRLTSTTLEASGAAMIAWALATFDHDTVFPGPYAIFPTAGTALILMARGDGRLSEILRLKPLVVVGLISYALYLWHWPLMVAARLVMPEPPAAVMIAAMAGSAALAWLSYVVIERPIRAKTIISSRRSAWMVALASSAGVIVIALALGSTHSLAAQKALHSAFLQFAYPEAAMLSYINEAKAEYMAQLNTNYHGGMGLYDNARDKGKTCSFDNGNSYANLIECLAGEASDNNILIMGDSIGRDTMHALREAFPNQHFIMLHQSGCPPGESERCFASQNSILAELKERANITHIFLSFRYRPSDYRNVIPGISAAKSITNNVYMFGPTPVFMSTMDSYVRMQEFKESSDHISIDNRSMVSWDFWTLAAEAESLAEQQGITFVNMLPFFCKDRQCDVWADSRRGVFLFWDEQHLTKDGITSFASYLKGRPALAEFR